MKAASSALISYFNAPRPSGDFVMNMADLFTFTLSNGSVLTYTSFDLSVAWNGYTYAANSILVNGLKYKCSMGINVDKQQVTLLAQSTDTIGGVPFLAALSQGILDGAFIQRDRAFFSAWQPSDALQYPIQAVTLFKGRVSNIDEIGRTSAKITVASDPVLLDTDMPRNIFSPSCNHVLYDAGCGVDRASHTGYGTVAYASTPTQIGWAGSDPWWAQGSVTFTSGANAGVEVTVVNSWSGTTFQLAYPPVNPVAAGDTFSICPGCDHTMSTCQNKFGNLANFRGYPFVPPPQILTGPLASTSPGGGK